LDDFVNALQLPIPQVQIMLLELEFDGLIQRECSMFVNV